jgi:hypothetical protein
MTKKNKAAPGANRAASENAADHGGNHNATAQEISSPPCVSKYRQKLNRRALADVAERPLATALLSALQNRGPHYERPYRAIPRCDHGGGP